MWAIRRARPDEATALAELAESTFRETFAPDNTVQDMDLHCARYFTPEAQARELADPAMETLVVEDGSGAPGLLGYAQLRGGPAPPCVTGTKPIELQRFYVVPVLHGGGLARQLMDAVLAASVARGAETLWLGVWERNPRAIRFYGKYGFHPVGDQTFVLGTDPQRDLVLERPVAAGRVGV